MPRIQIHTIRIATIEDASGWQEYFYGKMGEVTKNIRTFALPYETKTYTFAMEYEYDSRKNCASWMKKEQFFSVSHSVTPLPPSTFYLPPVTWIHTFSAKEKDTETGLSYFGSRYYSSDLSIWLSVDPMSDKYPSLSPYVYCANNPIKLVDPNGEEIGKYYDLNGNYIGHDGIDDDKIYVVTGQPTGIPSSDPRDQYNKKDIFQVPSFGRRKEIVDKLEEFDKQSPNAEWGGVCGVGIIPNTTMYGIERNVWGEPSQDGDPTGSSRLEYRQLNAKDIGDKGINGFSVFFDYHSHGSGGWIQEPSKWLDSQTNIWKGDIPNVTQRLQVSSGPRTFAVFAMKEKNVYFYTNEGICGKMDFNTFRNLGQ